MSKLYGGIRSDWLSLEGKKRKTMDEEVRSDRAERMRKKKKKVRYFYVKKGVGACLACTFLVRNGLFRTGSYHNVLF